MSCCETEQTKGNDSLSRSLRCPIETALWFWFHAWSKTIGGHESVTLHLNRHAWRSPRGGPKINTDRASDRNAIPAPQGSAPIQSHALRL